jgi:hypothetical protein
MTTAACDTFFNIPELVEHLADVLPRRDLIHLRQTNRTINSIGTLVLWRRADLSGFAKWTRLLNSPESLKAFGDSADTIQSLNWNVNLSWYYINALRLYLDTTNSAAHRVIPTDALTHPRWGALAVPDRSTFVCLPPMLHLTHYACYYSYVLFYQCKDIVANYVRETHQHHHFWLLRLNRTTLKHLEFKDMPLESARISRDICRTVSQLDHLRTLRLTYYVQSQRITLQALTMLFFSCPCSLTEFDISRQNEVVLGNDSLDPEESDWDFDQGPLVIRREPLLHLTTLRLPKVHSHGDFPGPILSSILEHCPALKILAMPFITAKNTIQAVAKTLGEHCPGITDLSVISESHSNGEALVNILAEIPGPRLENVYVHHLYNDTPNWISIAAISRHSETLRKIEFPGCRKVGSAILQTILVTCRALEILRAQDEDSWKNSISLKDAVMSEWVCTRVHILEIAVTFTPDGRDPAYLADQTMTTWTEQNHDHFSMLNKFYTQIGALVNLEVLTIKSAGCYPPVADGPVREIPFRETCLPGLLALEDVTTGQTGFLSRWAGLTQLRELRGSFLWSNKEAKARMGEREVEWFATHLPALKLAMFVNTYFSKAPSDKIPRLLQDLHGRRQDVRLDYEREEDDEYWGIYD